MNLPLRSPAGSSPPSLRPRPARQQAARPASSTQPPRRAGTSPRQAMSPGGGDGRLQRGLKAALLVAVAAGSAFGVVKVRDMVETTRHLPLRTVAVISLDKSETETPAEFDATRASEVRAYAELEDGEPWLGINTDDVKARVERHPFVREARVQRRAPDTIEIAVELREPAAVLRQDDRLYLVDGDGEVMKRVRPGDHVDAAIISLLAPEAALPAAGAAGGEAQSSTPEATRLRGLGDALAIVAAFERHGLSDRLSEVVAVPGAGFEVVFDDGARARLGDNDIDNKLRRLLSAERRLKEKGRSFSFMWLDDAQRPERVAVRLRPVTETTPTGG